MRYVFWMGLCALVSYSLASKAGSVIGWDGAAFGTIAYGASIGLSLAVATRPGTRPRLLPRVLISITWVVLSVALCYRVFRRVSFGTNQTITLRGLLFALPGPLIWIGRGVDDRRKRL